MFRQSKIGVAFPFLRHNRELADHAGYSFKISQPDLVKARFPHTVKAADGTKLARPHGW